MINIFIGKGGVGKSTCSSIFATSAVEKGEKTLLDSMDPAHNLHDIFQMKLKSTPKKVKDNFYLRESDIDELSKKYIKSIENQLKGVYHYQQSLNIDKYFSVLKYAPGTEEYASLLALERCFNDDKFSSVYIDTPPTALTLKTLALASVNLHWIDSLMDMRKKIIDKKNTISHIRKENLETLDEDPVYIRLIKMKKRYENINALLKDPSKVQFYLVLNEDLLSLSESKLIKQEMDDLGFSIGNIVLNKAKKENSDYYLKLKEVFNDSKIYKVPFSHEEVVSFDKIKELISQLTLC